MKESIDCYTTTNNKQFQLMFDIASNPPTTSYAWLEFVWWREPFRLVFIRLEELTWLKFLWLDLNQFHFFFIFASIQSDTLIEIQGNDKKILFLYLECERDKQTSKSGTLASHDEVPSHLKLNVNVYFWAILNKIGICKNEKEKKKEKQKKCDASS